MTIATWPILDQPREKIFRLGPKNLSDTELIAIFLRTGIPGKTALDLARDLLSEYGSLKKLFNAEPEEIFKRRGIGKAKYAMFKAAIELGRRYLDEDIIPGKALINSQATKKYLLNRLQNYDNEVFACLFLDIQNKIICFEELFFGTLYEANVYPREVVKRALKHNAAKIILAHNHPSGNPMPSPEDQEITLILKQALALIEVKVIDHIVVGNNTTTSFAEIGLL